MELILRVLKWSLTAGAVTALVVLLKPLLDRRFTPRWRYWLWLVLAMALILSPVSPGALPKLAVTVTAPEVRVPVPNRTHSAPENPGTPVTPGNPMTPADPVTPGTPVASESPVTPDKPHTDAAARQTVELSAILTAVWLLGAAVFVLWHMAGTALLSARLRRWSVPAGGGTVLACRELSKELGLQKAPKIGVSRGLASPLVAGLFRPRLWLPDRAWEERELAFILRHELTHIKRRDLWYKALMLLANALHWFNPLVWLLRREAGETAELLCDSEALCGADQETRRAYCETLLEHICRVPGAALTTHFYGGTRSVKTRFKNLLSNNKRRFGWAALAFCVLVLTVTACAVGVGATKSVPPEEFDGKYTASLFKYVFIRDENDQRVQDKAVLINSTDELKRLRRDYGIEPLDEGYRVINGELVEKLDSYTGDYFRENVLVVLIREMGSGSFELAVEGVELDGDALTVTLSSYNPTAPDATMDLCQWCILVECKRVEGVASARGDYLKNSETLNSASVIKWFDYLNGDEMDWDGTNAKEYSLDEFPGVTFRWQFGLLDAVTEEETVTLYVGMPIWSVYFCDLTGDGNPEICSTVSFGSGIIDNRIIVYDYARGLSFELSDRLNFDYVLNMREDSLIVEKRGCMQDELLESGELVFLDDTIQMKTGE